MTPATYGRGGRGATIQWATTETAVGQVLVAATARGLCFVEIGDAIAPLVATLREEFPQAAIAPTAASTLDPYLAAVRDVVNARPLARDLPLDIRGTAFQWRVWRALTEIPAGETRTYTQLADAVGHPAAVRAAARACALNPLSLVVPCHRVVGRDGSLTGYRWGTARKRALIEIEKGKSSSAMLS